MAQGDRYIFSKHITVRLGNENAINIFGVGMVEGSVPIQEGLPQLYKTPTQMVQVAPGHKWCSCCANVRPKNYFDVVEWDMRGTITKWHKGKPVEWDGVPVPVKWAENCKQCVNMRDPKERTEKYCSCCKQDKRRDEFSEDTRNVDGLRSHCKACRAEGERNRYQERRARELGYAWAV